MTVLRSRKIVTAMESQNPAKTKGISVGVFEPGTPEKTLEDQSTTSPLSASPQDLVHGAVALGSGNAGRRSLRLASKLYQGLVNEGFGVASVEKIGKKRKRSNADANLVYELNLGATAVLGNVDVVGKGDLQVGGRSLKVSDIVNMEVGVLGQCKVGVDATIVEPKESGSPAVSGNTETGNGGVGRGKRGSRKTNFGVDVELSGWMIARHDHGQNEKEVLSLRSGKKIVKIDAKSVDVSPVVKSNDGNEAGGIADGCDGNDLVMSESEAKGTMAENYSTNSGKTLTRKGKGKEKIVDKVSFTNSTDSPGEIEKVVDHGFTPKSLDEVRSKFMNGAEKGNESRASGSSSFIETTLSQNEEQINTSLKASRRDPRERFRDIARQNASRFAHFSAQDEEGEDIDDGPGGEAPPFISTGEREDWPGPFSTAMKIIKDRQKNASLPHQNTSVDKRGVAPVLWIPRNDRPGNHQKHSVPSLLDICMTVLVKNADAVTSLDYVPDEIRHKISQLLSDSRRMDSHFFRLLVQGSPTEIRVRDCSWLTEEIFTETFKGCDINNLKVLQLDQCGRCLADYILLDTLACSPNSLPMLTTVSLRGAYRLSDVGLSALVSSAPSLRYVDLSQCSLLTSDGICCLALSLGSILRELYLDDCQGIDATLILPALITLQHLEVLSLSGLETVCDDFISKFIRIRGHCLKGLVLADCVKLTDSCVRVIAENCSELCALDLSNLSKLTDTAIGYLANGCRAIRTLKLCRNSLSDEAVAAYLETCGASLLEFSLSNVGQVAQNTAISLARHSNNLQYLDLSWCRNLTDDALGLIVDSCSSLKILKLFGCTQITDVFLLGHSNPEVQIIGLKMKSILEHLKQPDFSHGLVRYSSASF